jgi:hypothetical protein
VRIFMIVGIILTVLGVYFLYQALQPHGPFDFGGAAAPILALTFLPMGVIFTAVGFYFSRAQGQANQILTQGIPGSATIIGVESTNMYVNNQPMAKLTLNVQLPGRPAYVVEKREVVPLLALGQITPGASLPVAVDPANPQKIVIDWSGETRLRAMNPMANAYGAPPAMQAPGQIMPNTLSSMSPASAPPNVLSAAPMVGSVGAGMYGAPGQGGSVVSPSGGMEFNFDPSGRPVAGETDALVGAVRSGALPTIKGSAAQLLATGTRGIAEITTAQPMGKTVRDINPNADPARLNDPMWLFTVTCNVPGQPPFPAVFGHRVPVDKVASLAPGVRLNVAVNLADRMNEVAIDWDTSPIVG